MGAVSCSTEPLHVSPQPRVERSAGQLGRCTPGAASWCIPTRQAHWSMLSTLRTLCSVPQGALSQSDQLPHSVVVQMAAVWAFTGLRQNVARQYS